MRDGDSRIVHDHGWSVKARREIAHTLATCAAHHRGYAQVFVEDAMAARDADMHALAVKKFFPTIGRVRSTDEVLAAL